MKIAEYRLSLDYFRSYYTNRWSNQLICKKGLEKFFPQINGAKIIWCSIYDRKTPHCLELYFQEPTDRWKSGRWMIKESPRTLITADADCTMRRMSGGFRKRLWVGFWYEG